MACVDLSWLFSWKDYWYAGISAVIGTLLGVTWANWQMAGRLRSQQAKDKKSLLASIDFNLERLSQMSDMLKNQSILPNFLLDADTLSKRLDAISDAYSEEIISDLSWQRYQLDHINSKLNFIHATSPTTNTGTVVAPTRLSDLLKHVDQTFQDLTTLRPNFESDSK